MRQATRFAGRVQLGEPRRPLPLRPIAGGSSLTSACHCRYSFCACRRANPTSRRRACARRNAARSGEQSRALVRSRIFAISAELKNSGCRTPQLSPPSGPLPARRSCHCAILGQAPMRAEIFHGMAAEQLAASVRRATPAVPAGIAAPAPAVTAAWAAGGSSGAGRRPAPDRRGPARSSRRTRVTDRTARADTRMPTSVPQQARELATGLRSRRRSGPALNSRRACNAVVATPSAVRPLHRPRNGRRPP